MLIEVIGMPGSGKSTLVGHCMKDGEAHGLNLVDRRGLHQVDQERRTMRRFVWKNPTARSVYRAQSFLTRHGALHGMLSDLIPSQNELELAMVLYAGTTEDQYQSFGKDFDFTLLEEFFVHQGVRAIAATQDGDKLQLVDQLVDLMPRIDCLIVLNISADTGFERLQQRHAENYKRRKRAEADPNAIAQEVRSRIVTERQVLEQNRLLEHCLARLQDRGSSIIEIDAEQSMEDVAEEMLAHLASLNQHRRQVSEALARSV